MTKSTGMDTSVSDINWGGGSLVPPNRPPRERDLLTSELDMGGEFSTDGYYIATISGTADKRVIEQYIRNHGREKIFRSFDSLTLD